MGVISFSKTLSSAEQLTMAVAEDEELDSIEVA